MLAGLVLLVGATAALAEDGQERARRAVESGAILPLRDILTRAQADCPGQLLEAELEGSPEDEAADRHGDDHDGKAAGLRYELKIATPEGHVVKLLYDARTGALLRRQGHGGRR